MLAQEISHLEEAYAGLQTQFYQLKTKWETSHQTLEQIVAYMSDGLMFVTKEGLISLFNPAAAELLQLPATAMIGSSYREHFSDQFFGFSMQDTLHKKECHQRIFLTLNVYPNNLKNWNLGCDQARELSRQPKSNSSGCLGIIKEIEVSTSSIPEKGILLMLCNRTERQQLEESLNQADKLKALGEMAATLAHEIRNPLGGIEGFAQLLKRDLETPAHQRMIHAILEGTSTLGRLVNQVLDYARPLSLHFTPVDLVVLIQEMLAAPPYRSVCSFCTAHPSYFLSIDREMIKLVLQNLLRNALEAEASEIGICLAEDGNLLIKDNGKGISPQNLKKLFTPFFTTKARGTGLGLAHSLAVIKAHGGTLEVRSKEGNGSEFILCVSKKS